MTPPIPENYIQIGNYWIPLPIAAALIGLASGLLGAFIALVGREWLDRRTDQRRFDRDEHLRRRNMLSEVSAGLFECISIRREIVETLANANDDDYDDPFDFFNRLSQLRQRGDVLYLSVQNAARAYANTAKEFDIPHLLEAIGTSAKGLHASLERESHEVILRALLEAQQVVEKQGACENDMARHTIRPGVLRPRRPSLDLPLTHIVNMLQALPSPNEATGEEEVG